jgi:2',3'-cyclic-nucleotide 2'-phosphodiesterase/3'-nucleotidase
LNLSYNGQPLAPDQPFVLATNSYRASGSGGFVGPTSKALPLGPPRGSREALAAYIAQNAPVAAEAPPPWHFMPMPNTTVVFDTAPRVESHLPSLTPLRATPLSITPQGFRRFRLHL